MAQVNRKIKSKSILDEYKILKEIEKGRKAADIRREHNVSKQTVSNWLKDKNKIYATVDANTSGKKRKRVRSSPFENIEKALYTWFVYARHKKATVTTLVLQLKALYFAQEFGVESFTASDGWIDRWKKKHNISIKTVSGI